MSVSTATIATVDEQGVTLLIDDEEGMHFMSLVSLLRKGDK
jgi:hypothetical protein